MTPLLTTLRDEWDGLMPASADPKLSSAVFAELTAAYTSPDRHYHNLGHIQALLDWLNVDGDLVSDRSIVALAILFHDAVYDARNPKGNEQASADLARVRLQDLGFARETVDTVARYVEATVHDGRVAHDSEPDLSWLLDADLSILAAHPADYDTYAAAIRREYAHVPDDLYRAGRTRVLTSFLGRPRIYLRSDTRDAWEALARANLGREIACLAGN